MLLQLIIEHVKSTEKLSVIEADLAESSGLSPQLVREIMGVELVGGWDDK